MFCVYFRSHSFNIGSQNRAAKEKHQDPPIEHDLYVTLEDLFKVGETKLILTPNWGRVSFFKLGLPETQVQISCLIFMVISRWVGDDCLWRKEQPFKIVVEKFYIDWAAATPQGVTKRMKISRRVVENDNSVRKEEKVLTINVKPGWKTGTKITFQREGDQVRYWKQISIRKDQWKHACFCLFRLQTKFLQISCSS